MTDLIDRQAAIDALRERFKKTPTTAIRAMNVIQNLPPAQPELIEETAYIRGFEQGRTQGMIDAKQEWIPCSERLPDDLEDVNVTWTNHRFIKDVPVTASAVHYKDKWFWCSATCIDEIDGDIEVLAWKPLPEPWEG